MQNSIVSLSGCLTLLVGVTKVSCLLGAGEGPGSCLAAPFRADPENVAWPEGCPEWAECCSEYGFCQTKATWEDGTLFRDCNGESNGLELPLRELQAELVEKRAGREPADDNLLGIDEGITLEELVEALEELEREEAENEINNSLSNDSNSPSGNEGSQSKDDKTNSAKANGVKNGSRGSSRPGSKTQNTGKKNKFGGGSKQNGRKNSGKGSGKKPFGNGRGGNGSNKNKKNGGRKNNKAGGRRGGNGGRKGGNRFNNQPKFPDYSGGSDNVIPLNGLYNRPV